MAHIQSGIDTTLATVDSTYKALNVINKGTTDVKYNQDNFTLDGFDRLRVSDARIAFEFAFNAQTPTLATTVWESSAYGAGTEALTTLLAGVDLSTTTAATTGRFIQSYNHIRCAPGVSTLMRFSFNFNELSLNVIRRIGMFTDQGTFPSVTGDGLFLELSGASISFVRRYMTTNPTGTEERVFQANWNIDTMDGLGKSGVNLDWTTAQQLIIEYQHLGTGTIKYGFETEQGVIWAHKIVAVNNLSSAWARTGSLPVRAECYSTSALATVAKLTLYNCVVIQEGDVSDLRGWRYFGANSGTTAKLGGTAAGLYPVLSIKAAATNDLTKRTRIIPTQLTISVVAISTGATSLQAALLMLPTPNTGATFAGTIGGSSTIIDTIATATTAITGTAIWSGVIPNVIGTYVYDLSTMNDNANNIGYNAAGTSAIVGSSVLTLAVGTLTGTASVAASIVGALNWKELV